MYKDTVYDADLNLYYPEDFCPNIDADPEFILSWSQTLADLQGSSITHHLKWMEHDEMGNWPVYSVDLYEDFQLHLQYAPNGILYYAEIVKWTL